jgi:transcriptional regulator GlxA family with amidase domain
MVMCEKGFDEANQPSPDLIADGVTLLNTSTCVSTVGKRVQRRTRLGFVQKWEVLAQKAGYRARHLAELVQTSLRTLERHFQKHYGVTVSKWLRELRLKHAYNLLQTEKSVKEVAFDHGYKQVSHFSREFKNHFGVSPSFLSALQTRRSRASIYRQISPTSPQMIFTF